MLIEEPHITCVAIIETDTIFDLFLFTMKLTNIVAVLLLPSGVSSFTISMNSGPPTGAGMPSFADSLSGGFSGVVKKSSYMPKSYKQAPGSGMPSYFDNLGGAAAMPQKTHPSAPFARSSAPAFNTASSSGKGAVVLNNHPVQAEDDLFKKWKRIDNATPVKAGSSAPGGRAVPNNFVPAVEDQIREKWQLIDQEGSEYTARVSAAEILGRAVPHNFSPTVEDYMREKWQKIDDAPKALQQKQGRVIWSSKAL
jgi:hypothetical protein